MEWYGAQRPLQKGVRLTRNKQVWSVVGLLPGVFLLVATGCGGSSNAKQKTPEPVAAIVEATPVVRETVERQLTVTGSLLPAAETTVSAEVSGRVVRLDFDVQRTVRQGDVLAQLDDTEYRLQLAQARASLAQARLNVERAEADYARDVELQATGSISQRALEISRTTQEAARAQVEASVAAVTLAEKRLQDTAIRAPISGVITARNIDVGDYVRSPEGVAVIMQINPLKMQLAAPERFAAAIQQGQPVTVSVEAYPDQRFEGKVTRINPSTDPATRTFTVEGALPNADGRLKPGFFARATIVTGVLEQAVMAPEDALLSPDDKPAMFVSRNGSAVLTPVEVGDRYQRMVEIRSGVTEQDTVLISGHTTLTDGARIAVTVR